MDLLDPDMYKKHVIDIKIPSVVGLKNVSQEREIRKGDNGDYEKVVLKVAQGSFVSAIGQIELNETGKVALTNVLAILAGGVSEAKNYLKTQMKAMKQKSMISGLLCFTVFAFVFQQIYFEVNKYFAWRNVQNILDEQQEILDAQEDKKDKVINRQQTVVKRMPTKAAEEVDSFCKICMCNPSNIVIVPCNHLCMCGDCFLEFLKQDRKDVTCPVCRLPVDLDHKIRINYDPNSEIELMRSKTVIDFLER